MGLAEATGGSEAGWGLGTRPPSRSLGCRLLPVQVDDARDEAVAVGGARPHLELRGGQFPPVYRPGHQAFPCPGLLQPVQGGLQCLFEPKVGWVGPGGQTNQPTWGGAGEEQVSGVTGKLVPFPLTSSQAEVLPALNPGQLFPISKPLGLADPSLRHIASAPPACWPPMHPSRLKHPFRWEFLAESP